MRELSDREQYINKNEVAGKTKEIKEFCRKHYISGQDLFLAYQIALGAEDLGPNVKLAELVRLLSNNFKNGYPLNGIAELASEMMDTENQKNDIAEKKKIFLVKLDEFKLSDSETKILLAIANQRRTGQLSIYKGEGGDEILRISIVGKVSDEDKFSEEVAKKIIESIRMAKEKVGEKISIILES